MKQRLDGSETLFLRVGRRISSEHRVPRLRNNIKNFRAKKVNGFVKRIHPAEEIPLGLSHPDMSR